LAINGWNDLADELERVAHDPQTSPAKTLERALTTLLAISHNQPHLYALMWNTPSGDTSALMAAAGRSQDLFLEIVARAVGPDDARRYGALLMSSSHGIASMELSGHLASEKWSVDGDELIKILVGAVVARNDIA
jgi:hypothetical protein